MLANGHTNNAAAGPLRWTKAIIRSSAFRIIMAHKALVILAAAIGIYFVPFNTEQYRVYYAHWPPGITEPTLATRLAAWNGAQYLILSQEGYQTGAPSAAFYPLWPALIRCGTAVTRVDPLVVAILFSNILSFAALLLLYRLIERQYGDEIAGNAMLLLLAAPGAFFLFLPYTESLFLFLTVALFFMLQRDRHWGVPAVSFLLPLTKAVGVFIFLPLAWHLWEHKKNWRQWLLLAAPLLGYGTYFLVMFMQTGDATAGFAAQKFYPHAPSIANALNFPGFWKASLDVGSVHGMTDSILDRGLFLLLLVCLPAIYRTDKTWFWLCLGMGIVPALTNWYMSYRRFSVICFPLFVLVALIFNGKGSRWLVWCYAVICAGLQANAITRHFNFYWAG